MSLPPYRYITDRYQGFLSENYTHTELYVRSSDYDRTLMSAESQLAGLFPPEGDQIFDPSIPWQPIPVHTVPKESDTLFKHPGCPKYTELLAADKDSAMYKKLDMDNRAFFDKVENCTGLEMVNLSNIYQIQDTLYVEMVYGYKTPSCLNESDFVRMTDLDVFTLSLRYNTHEKQRITAGNWTQKVLRDMKGKAFGNEAYNDSKLYLYSAHDTTVACMMTAMGVWDYKLPEYAAAFFIELLSNKTTGEYFVEMYHRANTSSNDITLLTIPGCRNETRCTLEQFETFASTLIPDDWQAECGLEGGSDSDETGWKVIAIVFVAMFGVSVIVICILCIYIPWKRKGTQGNLYEQV